MENGNPFALIGAGLNDLIKYAGATEIRIFCKKHIPDRTFHLKTDVKNVVPIPNKPNNCKNVIKLKDDNARMWETDCTTWNWGHHSAAKELEPYIFVVFVWGAYDISLGANSNTRRYECDDNVPESRTYSKGVWKYFVR